MSFEDEEHGKITLPRTAGTKLRKLLCEYANLTLSDAPRGPIRVTAGTDATLAIDGNTVAWDVPGGNRAVRRARSSPLGKMFFEFLEEVEWTNDTGGIIIGNDECNEDVNDYLVDDWGPRGERLAGLLDRKQEIDMILEQGL